MERVLVIHDQRCRVVLDLDGDCVVMSVDEAHEVARALVEAAERCGGGSGQEGAEATGHAQRLYRLGA